MAPAPGWVQLVNGGLGLVGLGGLRAGQDQLLRGALAQVAGDVDGHADRRPQRVVPDVALVPVLGRDRHDGLDDLGGHARVDRHLRVVGEDGHVVRLERAVDVLVRRIGVDQAEPEVEEIGDDRASVKRVARDELPTVVDHAIADLAGEVTVQLRDALVLGLALRRVLLDLLGGELREARVSQRAHRDDDHLDIGRDRDILRLHVQLLGWRIPGIVHPCTTWVDVNAPFDSAERDDV